MLRLGEVPAGTVEVMVIALVVLACGVVCASIAVPLMRRSLRQERGVWRFLLLLPLVFLVIGALSVPVLVAEGGPWGGVLGVGMTLLAWSVPSLGTLWNLGVVRALRRLSDSMAAERPDIEARFRSNWLLRWVMRR
jgi:ABC-type spermidine/putrescine transport system permease subunit II